MDDVERNLAGKVIVITGGSSGVGAAAARELARRGATVAITGRSDETARLAMEIGANHFLADFASFDDVRRLATALTSTYRRIDVLVNNAGAIIGQRQATDDGHEKTLQVNHLSPFLLTLLLRSRLEASAGGVINTSSDAHRRGHIPWADLESTRSYNAWRVYAATKVMNILHAAEIGRRFRGVAAASFHPGVVATGFGREGNALTRLVYLPLIAKLVMITPEKGADTLVWLASGAPGADWTDGEYYVRRKPGKKTPEAADANLARKLWDLSERMVGAR